MYGMQFLSMDLSNIEMHETWHQTPPLHEIDGHKKVSNYFSH